MTETSRRRGAELRAMSSFSRALWGLELGVEVLPRSDDGESQRPHFSGARAWLPTALVAEHEASSYLLAATAHIAAHRRFGGAPFAAGTLKPLQIALVSLIEDARVEHLARAQYPGLSRLWSAFHAATPSSGRTAHALLARLARVLHEEDARDDDAWVEKGRALFFEQRAEFESSMLSRRIGGILGNDLGQMRIQFNARDYAIEPAYRDDHRGIWQFERESSEAGDPFELESTRLIQDSDRAPQRQRASPRTAPEPREAPNAKLREGGTQRVASTVPSGEASDARYPEWDYVIRCERAAFSSLRETPLRASDAEPAPANLSAFANERRQLARPARRIGAQRALRLRRQLDGNRLDLPALIAAQVARSAGTEPDPRVYRSLRFQREPPLLLLLLDLSQSLNATPDGCPASLLDLARAASLLLAASLEPAAEGAPTARGLAIHGFSSNGRHDVAYHRFKEFDERYSEAIAARLAGMRASRSTRLGAALRHAGAILQARRAARKILLVISDGEPSDVDVHDDRYLLWDAWHATEHNRKRGIQSFCLGLEPRAEASVQRIFGPKNYLLLRRTARLPDELGRLYLRLARLPSVK